MDAPSATTQARAVATKAMRFLDLIAKANWRDACVMCPLKDEKMLRNFISVHSASVGKFVAWRTLAVTNKSQAYAVAEHKKGSFQLVLKIDLTGPTAVCGLSAPSDGSCRDPEPNEQILLSYVSDAKGEWVAATSGTASVGASATLKTLPNKAPSIPLSPVVVPYLYAGARRTELHEAARFILLLESGKWAEAAQMSILKTSDGARGFHAGSVGALGAFVRLREASVASDGTVYIRAEHQHGFMQWVVCVSRSVVGGLDARPEGAMRAPTENGNTIVETVCALQNDVPAPEWWRLTAEPRPLRLEWKYPINKKDLDARGVVRILLPPNRPYQRHLRLSVEPTPSDIKCFFQEGNTFAEIAWHKPPSAFVVTLDLAFDATPPPMQGDLISKDPPDRYLQPTLHTSAKIDPKHPKVGPIVAKVVGSETDVLKKAQLIATHVAKIPYEMPPPGRGWPTLDEYLSNYRYVECGGHAILFVLFCRAAGIPARRLFWPFLSIEKNGELKIGSHEIAEFYHPEHSWIAVDSTTGPFDVTNRKHWRCLPMTGGSVPRALLLHVESQSGAEQKAWNHARHNAMRDARITVLPAAAAVARP